MAVQGVRLVLGQDCNLEEPGIDEVGQHEVNEAVGTAKWDGGLGAVLRQREQALSLTAGEDNGKDIWKASHAYQPIDFFHISQEKYARFYPHYLHVLPPTGSQETPPAPIFPEQPETHGVSPARGGEDPYSGQV